MEVYYISGCVPYNGKSGGRLASYNHLCQLCSEFDTVKAFFVDVNNDYNLLENMSYPSNLEFTVYSRELSKINFFSIKSILISFLQIFFSLLPRNIYIGHSSEIERNILDIHNKNRDAIFIFDNIDACGNIPKNLNINYIYISHNVETKLIFDTIKYSRKLLIPYHLINAIKMYFFEKKILSCSLKNIFISDKDMSILSKYGKSKLYLEYIQLQKNKWNLKNTNKSILFLGSASHFPNKEAVIWIVKELSKSLNKIDSEIVINICGLNINDLKIDFEIPNNINFLGKVSDEELINQFIVNRIFLSPVILGSGIKIKILEAASYGIPIICTSESIDGLEYLRENVKVSSRKDFAKDIKDMIQDDLRLERQSAEIINKIEKISKESKKYFT